MAPMERYTRAVLVAVPALQQRRPICVRRGGCSLYEHSGPFFQCPDGTLQTCLLLHSVGQCSLSCKVPLPQWNVTQVLAFCMQGGGMRIGGNATLNSCQIYDNEAETLVLAFRTCWTLLSAPQWNVTQVLAFCMQGGGLAIRGSATLEYCDIFGNIATDWASARFLEPLVTFHGPDGTLRKCLLLACSMLVLAFLNCCNVPAPRWNVTRVLAFCMILHAGRRA